MDTWPIGTRDTTEFPKISPVEVQYRDHLEKILQLNGKNWNDIGAFGTPSRFRSYRKMYERLGIICKNGDKLVSTWLGEKIAKLEQGLLGAQQVYLDQMRSEIIAILSRYQFKNPSDRDSVSFPDDFDIQPCVCFWKMMLALDNKINYQEVNRVVLRIMHMADIDAAIEKIKTARTTLVTNPGASLDDILGLPVVSDQPTARIAGLFSQIGWGDLLITGVQEDGFRYLISDAIPAIQKVIENPPHFYEAKSEKDWIKYFIGEPRSVTFENVVPTSNIDRLGVALKLFAEKRKEEEWCSDKTDGDANKPRAGYVANKQLRVLSNTPADIGKLNGDGASNIKAWFKNYWNVADGKSWLEGLSDADLSGFGPYIAHLLQPGSPVVAKPAKFSNALEAAVKAVIKPEETGLYDERVNETLKFLGLIGFDWNENFDADDLGEAVNAQRVIKRRLKDMGIKRIQESPTADDGNAPDYLTVNEFLWFVNKNLNAIEKQVLEGKMVAAKHEAISSAEKTRKPKCDMSSHDDVLLLRLRAALRTKPFAILAGHSGTGKSRMVRQLAYMTCNDAALRKDEKGNPAKDPGNFCMVQVKPNWHDSGDLLGYYSELGKRYRASDFVKFIVKAYAYPDTPFFVCLDEMNLAPVEQYFAEYLSAIESRKIQKVKVLKGNPLAEAEIETVVSDELIPRSAYVEGEEANRVIHYDWLGCELKESEHWIANYGLTIPRNLFVVGTVNMDESTNQFSRKVLDRAMTLEMTDADFKSFGKKGLEPSYDNYMGDDAVADLLAGKIQAEKLEDHQIGNLNALKTVLGATSFAVAYRFANEYALYETSLKETQTKTDTTSVPTPAAGAPAPAPAVNAAQAAAPATPPPDGETAAATPAEAVPAEAVPAIPAKPLAFDDMILMKVLPRISGEDVVVRRIFFGENGKFSDPKPGSLLELVQKGGTDTESVRKIKAIDERGGAYLSFWP